MSCQQATLVQEDPYIFTDTVSSNPGKLTHNSSPILTTKYVPLVRSSQTIYNRPQQQQQQQTQQVNGVQSSKPQTQQQQKLVVIQPPVNGKSSSLDGVTSNNKSIAKTVINPPQFTKSPSQNSSFKVPQKFVQQQPQQPQKQQQQQPDVQQFLTHSTPTTNNHHPPPNHQQNSISSPTSVNLNIVAPAPASAPPAYTSSSNSQHQTTFVLPNQQLQQPQPQSQQKNVIQQQQQLGNQSANNETNFQQIKANAGISNGKIVYTIPLSNTASNSVKKTGTIKPPGSKRKNSLNDGLQVTTSKDGKMVILPMKVNKVNGVQQTVQTSTTASPVNNVVRKKRLSKLSQSDSMDSKSGTSQKSSNVVTASVSDLTREWHAPDTYMFDCTDSLIDTELSSCIQQHWFVHESDNGNSSKLINCDNNSTTINSVPSSSSETTTNSDLTSKLTRDQRIKIKKNNLRRQTVQYWNAQTLRCTKLAQQRLLTVAQILHKLNLTKDELFTKQAKKCTVSSCNNEAIILTAFCFQHILNNKEQRLFHSCTAKFSDNSQCRVPVYDISHDLPLCREHAMKRDNYQRMLQEQKPRKAPRKKPKPSAMIRPGKRNKKKKKFQIPNKTIIHPNVHSQQQFINQDQDNQFLHQNSGDLMALATSALSAEHLTTQPTTTTHLTYKTDDMILNKMIADHSGSVNEQVNYLFDNHNYVDHVKARDQLMYDVNTCENSYESSEDTGVGGLSETDIIERAERDWLMKHHSDKLLDQDLTHVLNQLPIELENIFEPQHVQGELESALEDFESQIETDPINYFDEMLRENEDIILDEEEEHSEDNSNHHHHHHHYAKMNANDLHQARLLHDQQQLLSAAANLLNMSSSMSQAAQMNHHNQDMMANGGQQELRELVHT